MILFSPEYIHYTLLGIILLPGIIYASYTSIKVKSTFDKYNQILVSTQITGAECAKRILESEGITDVQIVKGSGELTDNYNSKTNVITLSADVYNGTTIAALGVAAHEVGHAIQHAKNYAGAKIHTALGVAGQFMSHFVWPIILIGIVLDFAYVGGFVGKAFLWAGVGFFGVSLLFSIITLPVELNASKRALKLLVSTNCVASVEVKGAEKVLSAAAQTYIAAIVVSVLELLRFVLFFFSRNKD